MEKPYRPCVVAVIRNDQGQLLAGERADHKGSWQLPQGGIDPGESPQEALFRELREEIGTDRLRLVQSLPKLIRYEFPLEMASGPAQRYRGQEQTWFLLELLPGEAPNLALSDGEFQDLVWISPSDLWAGIVAWKKIAYSEGLKAFGYSL